MPCDSVQITRLDAGKMQLDLLEKALDDLGWKPNRYNQAISFTSDYISGQYKLGGTTGTLTLRDADQSETDLITSQIKKAYSAQIVKQTAQKYGWTLKQGPDRFTYQIIKR